MQTQSNREARLLSRRVPRGRLQRIKIHFNNTFNDAFHESNHDHVDDNHNKAVDNVANNDGVDCGADDDDANNSRSNRFSINGHDNIDNGSI